MRRTILGALFSVLVALPALVSSPTLAETIGVSMATFDDRFLTVLRAAIEEHAGGLDGVDVQIEDAGNDVARQLAQIQTFAASGLDAIIVNPVDTDASEAMTKAAENAGIPLVYLNREPVNLDTLPKDQAFVGPDERAAGMLATGEVCRLLKAAGHDDGARVVVMMGELSNHAARTRTQAVHDVVETDACRFMTIVEEQAANWSREDGRDLMNNWLAAGVRPDAVLANNDEMALGAVAALKTGGGEGDAVVVAGIDGTAEALDALEAGDLDVTVFQDAEAQARSAVDTALTLARDEAAETVTRLTVTLVTSETVKEVRRNGR